MRRIAHWHCSACVSQDLSACKDWNEQKYAQNNLLVQDQVTETRWAPISYVYLLSTFVTVCLCVVQQVRWYVLYLSSSIFDYLYFHSTTFWIQILLIGQAHNGSTACEHCNICIYYWYFWYLPFYYYCSLWHYRPLAAVTQKCLILIWITSCKEM